MTAEDNLAAGDGEWGVMSDVIQWGEEGTVGCSGAKKETGKVG